MQFTVSPQDTLDTLFTPGQTLKIIIPSFESDPNAKILSALAFSPVSGIKYIFLYEDGYDHSRNMHSAKASINIPEVISRFVEVECIRICAAVTELPTAISTLKNLLILDLTESYNLLSIPQAIMEMSDLTIIIGDLISPASEVVFIPILSDGEAQNIISMLETHNSQKIEQLIIRQDNKAFEDSMPFELPERIKELKELKLLSLRTNMDSVPSWIGDLPELSVLDLSGCANLVSLPETIGSLDKLTTLNLTECSYLRSFPSSARLLQLSLLSLRNCSFPALPFGIEHLREVTSLDLTKCFNLRSLPVNIAELS